MMHNLALRSLQDYLLKRTRQAASSLKAIPSLCQVLEYEYFTLGDVRPQTHNVALWLYKRGELVRQTLCVERPAKGPLPEITLLPWQKVQIYPSCCSAVFDHNALTTDRLLLQHASDTTSPSVSASPRR